MLKLTKKFGSPARSAIRGWIALNAIELTWIALIVGGVLFVGFFFMSPVGLMSP